MSSRPTLLVTCATVPSRALRAGAPRAAAAAVLALLLGCSEAAPKQGLPTTAGPSAEASTPRSAPPPPVAPGSRAPLRENAAASAPAEGVSLEIRALRSRVAKKDPLGLALRLRPDTSPEGAAWMQASLDWKVVLPGIRFEVKTPSGAVHTLEVAEAPATSAWPVSLFAPAITIDGAGLGQGSARFAWKAPVAGLLDAPGIYEVTLTGSFAKGGPPVSLRAGPIPITVAEAASPLKPLVDLERDASVVARSTWGARGIPLPSDPTVDDVDGNLSVRFRRSAEGGSAMSSYDDEILEVWLDPAGSTLAIDAYRHFTCVAAGTRIATPRGPVAIEELTIGAEVESFDVATGARSVAIVLRNERSHTDALWSFGALQVTAEHPVWADGEWVPAGAVPPGAALLRADGARERATPVFVEVGGTVHDLTVTAPHTYFAGGLLVHNKAAHVPLGGTRPWGALFFRRASRP